MSVFRFGEKARMRDALLLIASEGCQSFTRSSCSSNGRIRGARYLGEAWCESCIANNALGRPMSRSSYTQAVRGHCGRETA